MHFYCTKGVEHFYCTKGVEKNNNDFKSIYYRHSNKWNSASDMLQCGYKLGNLREHQRQKRLQVLNYIAS